MEEGDAGVAQVGVLEGVHLVASLGDGPSRRAAAAEVEALEEDREVVLRMVHLSSLVVLVSDLNSVLKNFSATSYKSSQIG